MADDKTPEFSREEAQGLLFHGAPQPSVVEPAVQRASNIPVPPPVSIKSVEKGTPVAKAPNALSLVKTVSEANKELQQSVEAPKPPSAFGGLIDDLTANWKPLTIGAGAVITGMAAKRYLGRKDSTQPTTPTVKVEPTFATPEETATFKPVEQPAAPSKLAVESEAKFGVPLSDVEKHFDVKITNLKDAEILSNNYKNSLPGAVSNQPAGVPTIQPNVPANPAGAFAQPSGYSQATPQQTLTQAVETGGDVDQALKTDVAKMVDQAAPPAAPVSPSSAIKVEGLVRDAQGNFQYPEGMSPAAIQAHKSFVQQYPEISANLEAQGKFGMVGGGAADNSLHNSYGANLRKQILNAVNQGQMGGINTNYLENINPAIKALSSEEGLGKTLAELKANNPKGGIHGPLGTPATIGKAGELVTKPGAVSGAVNKGSKALLLMAMADAAKAAEKGNTAPAKEVGFDLATGYGLSKLLGGPAAAALALALGSSGLNAGEEQELARRRASRGIAPPNQR
jgi:hypothetical protein